MAKAILICGKVSSGKTTYAGKLLKENYTVLLSVDEITLALFGQHAGEKHDDYVERTQNYLFEKSLRLIKNGISVILDWGFWMKEERDFARKFYESRNIACEFHYIDIDDETWKSRLLNRNRAVSAGEENAYFIDENIAAKFSSLFEKPDKREMDVWIHQSSKAPE